MNEFNLLYNLDQQVNHFSVVKGYLKKSDSCTIISPYLSEDLNKYFSHIYGGRMRHVRLVTSLKGYEWEINARIRALTEFRKKCEKNGIGLEILVNNRLHSKVYLFKNGGQYISGIISSANFTDPGLVSNIEYGMEIKDQSILNEIDRSLFTLNRFGSLTEDIIDDVLNELEEAASKGAAFSMVEISLERIKKRKRLLAEGKAQFRDLIEKVDEYINSLKPESNRKTALLFRWNTAAESELTYEEIGILLGVTKQRISEIVINEIKGLKKYFAPVKGKYEEFFLKYLMLNPEPVDLDPDKKSGYFFKTNFYHGVLSEVFDSVPFRDHLNKSFNQPSFSNSKSRTPLEKRIFKEIEKLDPGYKEITLEDLLARFPEFTDNCSKLMVLKMCINSNKFFFNEIDGRFYILKDRRLEEIALEILEKSDSPLTSLGIYKMVSDTYGKVYKSEETSAISRLHNEGYKIGILRLDADLFGLEKHIGVPREKWGFIFEKVRSVIAMKNRQTYVTEILDEINEDLPELRSFYELGCILEYDDEIDSLGDYYYNLKGRQERKIEIREAVEEILREEKRTIGINELFELVFKRRYAAREGFKSVVDKIDTIVEEDGGYRLR